MPDQEKTFGKKYTTHRILKQYVKLNSDWKVFDAVSWHEWEDKSS